MSKWISCKDRMPDKDGRYLVCEPYSSSNGEWFGVSSLRNGRWDNNQITHWQPITEPPNE